MRVGACMYLVRMRCRRASPGTGLTLITAEPCLPSPVKDLEVRMPLHYSTRHPPLAAGYWPVASGGCRATGSIPSQRRAAKIECPMTGWLDRIGPHPIQAP